MKHKVMTIGALGLGLLAVMAIVSGCAAPASAAPNGGGTGITNAILPQQASGGSIANTISVNGYGEASGTPDVAYITLGVSVTDPDVGKAVTENNTKMQAVRQALIGEGIAEEDLQTIGFNVWPEDKYNPQTGELTGERTYHVDNSLTVKVHDLAKTGRVIEAALDAGANTVAGLSFGVEDTDALEAQARKVAADDAHARAQQLADALGVTLGDPILVTDGGAAAPQPFYPVMASADGGKGAGGGGTVPVSAGQMTVSVSVYVVYSIGQ